MASSIQLNSTNNSEMKIEYQGTSGVPKTVVVPDRDMTVAGTDEVIGVGQTWQDVTAQRVGGVTYTNTTGKPIVACCDCANNGNIIGIVNGVTVSNVTTTTTNRQNMTLIVPNGGTYSFSNVTLWVELR